MRLTEVPRNLLRGRLRATRALLGVATLAIVAASATACSTPSDDGSEGDVPSLRIATFSSAVNYAPLFIASEQGLFEKHDVDIQIPNSNAAGTMSALLVSGQIDLGITNAAQAAQVSLAGKQAQVLYNIQNFTGRTVTLTGTAGITSIDQLVEKGSACRLGTTGPGSAAFAWMNSFVEQKGLDQCEIVQFATNPLELAALTSGQVDAASLTVGDSATAVNQGANLILNPADMTDAEAEAVVPDPTPVIAVVGMEDSLPDNKVAIERFLAALLEASQILVDSTPEEVGEMLQRSGFLGDLTAEEITAALGSQLANFSTGAEAGFISEEQWDATRNQFATIWQLPDFDPDAPEVAYDKMIDMSFLNAARELD